MKLLPLYKPQNMYWIIYGESTYWVGPNVRMTTSTAVKPEHIKKVRVTKRSSKWRVS